MIHLRPVLTFCRTFDLLYDYFMTDLTYDTFIYVDMMQE